MLVHELAAAVASGLESLGVLVIAVGVTAVSVAAVGSVWRARGRGPTSAGVREQLARVTLLGLEFLVAADIVGTVTVTPTLPDLALLGGIIALRTFLSAALVLEVEGRWPWARPMAPDTPRQRVAVTVRRESASGAEASMS